MNRFKYVITKLRNFPASAATLFIKNTKLFIEGGALFYYNPFFFLFLLIIKKISVFDQDSKKTTVYKSISAAARALNFPNPQAISNYIQNNQKKPYKGRFIFKIDQ
jgi:hypothetical protein